MTGPQKEEHGLLCGAYRLRYFRSLEGKDVALLPSLQEAHRRKEAPSLKQTRRKKHTGLLAESTGCTLVVSLEESPMFAQCTMHIALVMRIGASSDNAQIVGNRCFDLNHR
jgi:hypothetical protein